MSYDFSSLFNDSSEFTDSLVQTSTAQCIRLITNDREFVQILKLLSGIVNSMKSSELTFVMQQLDCLISNDVRNCEPVKYIQKIYTNVNNYQLLRRKLPINYLELLYVLVKKRC